MQANVCVEIAQVAPGGLLQPLRSLLTGRQRTRRRGAAEHLPDRHVLEPCLDGIANRDRRQVRLHQRLAQRGVEVEHRDVPDPAAADCGAPAQAHHTHASVLRAVVRDDGARGVVAVLKGVGKDQPHGGRPARRSPRRTERRQHLRDLPATRRGVHPRPQPRIADSASLERRGHPAVLGGQPRRHEQRVRDRSDDAAVQHAPEPSAQHGQIVGGVPIDRSGAVVASEVRGVGSEAVERQLRLAVEAAETCLPERLVDHEQADAADVARSHVEQAVVRGDDHIRGARGSLLSLVAAGGMETAHVKPSVALDLAAALLDGLLHLERVGDGAEVAAHQLLGALRGRIECSAALPEHGVDAQRGEGCNLLGPEVVSRDGVDHLAALQPAVCEQHRNRLARSPGLAEADIHRQGDARRDRLDDRQIDEHGFGGLPGGFTFLLLALGLFPRDPVDADALHEARDGGLQMRAGLGHRQCGRGVGGLRIRHERCGGDHRGDSVWPVREREIVGVARLARWRSSRR